MGCGFYFLCIEGVDVFLSSLGFALTSTHDAGWPMFMVAGSGVLHSEQQQSCVNEVCRQQEIDILFCTVRVLVRLFCLFLKLPMKSVNTDDAYCLQSCFLYFFDVACFLLGCTGGQHGAGDDRHQAHDA